MRLVQHRALGLRRRQGPGYREGFRRGKGEVDIADPGFARLDRRSVLPVGQFAAIGLVACENVFPLCRRELLRFRAHGSGKTDDRPACLVSGQGFAFDRLAPQHALQLRPCRPTRCIEPKQFSERERGGLLFFARDVLTIGALAVEQEGNLLGRKPAIGVDANRFASAGFMSRRGVAVALL